ncbi:hypothetical protein [Erwinia sp. S38]|uniref:hypothetical protein n=1 Tax=Erwinia sp. S38 TaxID=2769338 RepID=UPI001F3294DF|nr:hypothetical protein [Erwinia sp. S38]
MSNLTACKDWVDEVYQIKRGDIVSGGANGTANIQARQLTSRTNYLKDSLEGLRLGERPYLSISEAQAAADRGEIPEGAIITSRTDNADFWFIECENIGGVIQPTGKTLFSGELVSYLSSVIRSTLSESEDSVIDFVAKNGVRAFRIRDDMKTELTEIVRLMTGDSGLTFSGHAIDNYAPSGWLFAIHSTNGLVIAGVKEDGTVVGFGGNGGGSGGGQSGEIIPGDTAATYDAIRQYSGPATVKDVVGNRIAGRFVVDASDTSSPDDGGGCLVDVLGRRWIRQADYVSWDMFGAPRVPGATYLAFAVKAATGDRSGAAALMNDQTPADDRIAACFDFAKKMNIPVRQNDGVFLWKNTEWNVYTCTNLNGSTIVTTDISGVAEDRWGPIPGLDDDAPEPVRMFIIRSRKARIQLTAAQIAALNTTYAKYLKSGSCQLPMPDLYPYRGGLLFVRSSAVKYSRNGLVDVPRQQVLYRDFARIGKNGALTDMMVENIPDGSVAEAFIVPKEDSYLTFEPPHFHESGNSRRFYNIEIYRPMTIIGKMSLRTDAYGSAPAWVKISAHEVFDVEYKGGQCDGSFQYAGAYVLSFRDCIDMEVKRFTGMYGWGVNGHHGTKEITFRDCMMNRIDWHTFGYNVRGYNVTLKGNGINAHGGGVWKFKDLTHIIPVNSQNTRGEAKQNYLVQARENYACDCDGVLEIDGLLIKFDTTDIPFTASTIGYDIVRPVGTQTTNDRHDTKCFNRISVKNVVVDCQNALNFAATPGNFSFTAVRFIRSERIDTATTGYKTYLPEMISVDGMTAINVPKEYNVHMNLIRFADDLYKNTFGSRRKKRPDGTNAEVIGRDIVSVINNPTVELDTNNTVWLPGTSANWTDEYKTSPYSWIPKITLDNCPNAVVDTRGAISTVHVTGGSLARYLNGNAESRMRINGSDIQLMPNLAGNLYFDSAHAVAFGCTWLNPAGGVSYDGSLRGASNENRGDVTKAPNIPSSVFI